MRRLPGDPTEKQDVESMIRVDHAGEYGAVRIYAGQLAVLRGTGARKIVEHMAEQEKRHLETFETIMRQRKVRPTALMPLWHIAGFALGAGSALLGEKAAFACTVAVESVIDEHYAAQRERLDERDGELAGTIETFRAEEAEHHDTSLAQGAEEAPLYPVLTAAVKGASRLAIWLSTRI
jgi:ubiquinone biosynthesis monooxygenase Coq7